MVTFLSVLNSIITNIELFIVPFGFNSVHMLLPRNRLELPHYLQLFQGWLVQSSWAYWVPISYISFAHKKIQKDYTVSVHSLHICSSVDRSINFVGKYCTVLYQCVLLWFCCIPHNFCAYWIFLWEFIPYWRSNCHRHFASRRASCLIFCGTCRYNLGTGWGPNIRS